MKWSVLCEESFFPDDCMRATAAAWTHMSHAHCLSGCPIYLKILKLDLCQSHLLLTLLLDSCTHSICSLPFGKADPLQPNESVPLWALCPSPPDSTDPFLTSESMESLHLCPLHRLESRKASALLKQLTNLYELWGAVSSRVSCSEVLCGKILADDGAPSNQVSGLSWFILLVFIRRGSNVFTKLHDLSTLFHKITGELFPVVVG